MPILGSLTKYASKPPEWFLDVDKKRLQLKSEQLYSPQLFALACLDQANLVVPVPKPQDWKYNIFKTYDARTTRSRTFRITRSY